MKNAYQHHRGHRSYSKNSIQIHAPALYKSRSRLAPRILTGVWPSILLGLCLVLAGCTSVNNEEKSAPLAPVAEKPSSAGGAALLPQGSPSIEGLNSTIASDVEKRINEERLAAGLEKVIWDETLVLAATQWAEHMSKEGYEHSPLDRLESIRTDSRYGALAENIHNPTNQCPSQPCLLEEYYPSSGTLHVDWMRSTEHRNAILEPGFSKVGVGVYCSANGDLWAVTLFASVYEMRIPQLTQTVYKEPVVGMSDGYTCTSKYRDHNPLWVNSPIK